MTCCAGGYIAISSTNQVYLTGAFWAFVDLATTANIQAWALDLNTRVWTLLPQPAINTFPCGVFLSPDDKWLYMFGALSSVLERALTPSRRRWLWSNRHLVESVSRQHVELAVER